MICSASLALALLVSAPANADSVPAPFALRVRNEVAARWQVDTAAVKLEWITMPRAEISDSAPFHLTGRGLDGLLVVVVDQGHGGPQALRIRAGVSRTVPVAAHALRLGDHLKFGDFTQQSEVIWSSAPVDLPPSLAGWEVRRDVAAGTPLLNNLIAAPRVIAAGDPVVFSWSDHGVRVEREGKAVAAARLGEMVQGIAGTVRLSGRVIGPGLAEMKERTP